MPTNLAKESSIVTLAEAEAKHRDEWVVMEVTHADKLGFAKRGRIISHSADKTAVVDAGLGFRQNNPGAHICLFYAGPVIPEGINVAIMAGRVLSHGKIG